MQVPPTLQVPGERMCVDYLHGRRVTVLTRDTIRGRPMKDYDLFVLFCFLLSPSKLYFSKSASNTFPIFERFYLILARKSLKKSPNLGPRAEEKNIIRMR